MRISRAGSWPIEPKPGPGYQSGLAEDMFPLSSTGTHEAKLSADTRVSGSGDTIFPIISGI